MMPGIKVDVEPRILQWILKIAVEQNMDAATIDRINSWVSGDKHPTIHQLEELGKKTNVPFGYFFLKTPPTETCEIVDFRTIDSLAVVNPSRNLIDTVDIMQRVQQWMSDYKRDGGYEPCSFVGQAKSNRDVKAAASRILAELHSEVDWITTHHTTEKAFKYMRSRITALGILVMMNGVVGTNTHRKLDTNEFRAFTLIDEYAPLIFINTADSSNGRLFSLLHELAHIWLGKASFYNDKYGISAHVSKEEQFCNAIAAEILVPDVLFEQEWTKYEDTDIQDIIEELSHSFPCSNFVLLRKALDHGKITKNEYGKLTAAYETRIRDAQQNAKKTTGGDFYNTLKSRWDPNFISALSGSVESGRTQYRDAYLLTNTTGKTFAALAEAVRGYEIG